MGNKTTKISKETITDEDLDFIAKNTAANKDEVKKEFDKFLARHPDGKITKPDFKDIMKVCCPNAKSETLDNIFPMYDFDGDGTIDFQEFMTVVYITSSGTDEESFGQIFRIFDTNRDGTISKEDMKRVVKNLYYLFNQDKDSTGQDESRPKSKRMMKQESKDFAMKTFKEMDVNSDGKVTKEEFITACLAQNVDGGTLSVKLALGIMDGLVGDS